MESVDNPLLTTFSTRLGRTTLARGILTGSLLGCTVLRGILIGRLVIVSPLLTEVLSLKTWKVKRESEVLIQDIERVFLGNYNLLVYLCVSFPYSFCFKECFKG